MRNRVTVSIAGAALLAAVVLAGCNKSSSPTDPGAHPAAASMAAVADASHGNDGGGNGGHGHGHGHPGQGALALQVHPDVWNTEYTHSQGSVQAFVTGGGLSDIDTSTIQLSGDSTGAPISPVSTRLVKQHLMATFSKMDAISLFPGAKPGEMHVVTLKFTQAGNAESLTDNVRIVGPQSTSSGD